MGYGVRVSKVQVRKVLEKYLDDALAWKIYWDIVQADEKDQRNMIGMTCGEWQERFDDDFEVVWADDTKAGFGKAGDSVYGTIDDCVICWTEYDGRRYKLFVWCEALSSDHPHVKSAMDEYHKRHAEETEG